MDLIKCEKNCLPDLANGPESTTGNEPSLGNYLHIHLEGTIKYALKQRTALCGYTPTRWIRPNWNTFDVRRTSVIHLAGFDGHWACTGRVVYWFRKQMRYGVCAPTTQRQIPVPSEIHTHYHQCNQY